MCPVGVGEPDAILGGMIGLNPVVHQMVKGLKVPMFDDLAESWPSFNWDFQDYLRKLSPTQEIPDEYKMRLFELAMPQTLKGEIRLMRMMNKGELNFSDIMARFEARYGNGGRQSCGTNGMKFQCQLREK